MNSWKYLEGNTPLLFVATHALPHVRKGELKQSDLNTGILAEELARNMNAYALISTKVQLDPNWYPESEFRKEIKRIVKEEGIRIVFDLHGRKNNWPTPIDYYPNKFFKQIYPDLLIGKNILEFKDDDQLTICEDISIPAVEIEIRRDGRESGTNKYKQILEGIITLANDALNSH